MRGTNYLHTVLSYAAKYNAEMVHLLGAQKQKF